MLSSGLKLPANVSDLSRTTEKLPVVTNLSDGSTRTKSKGIAGGRPCEPSLNMRKTSLMLHLSLKKDDQPGNQVQRQ